MGAALQLSSADEADVPVSAINKNVLTGLAALYASHRSGAITVSSATVRRVIHVVHGDVVWADSSSPDELLGNVLADEGRLDVDLIEPIVRQARAIGWFFGDQLVADGLFTAEEISDACEQQALMRFERAIEMPGEVRVVSRPLARVAMRRSIGELIPGVFRRTAVPAVVDYVACTAPRPTRSADEAALEPLRLTSSEYRVARHLLRHRSLAAAFASGMPEALVARTAGAMVALRLLA